MNTMEEALEAAVKFHGHLCGGQILGVRMSRLALRELGIEDPAAYRDLVVYVEADRCLADAVLVTTRCTMGRRRLKWMDFGKMAATFVDIARNRAIRIHSTNVMPERRDGEDLKEAWNRFTDEELFVVRPVIVDIPKEDLPGKPLQTVPCDRCGETIFDCRQVSRDDRTLCRACADGAYYQAVE